VGLSGLGRVSLECCSNVPGQEIFDLIDRMLCFRYGLFVGCKHDPARVPYQTFPDQPVGSFATAWGTAKRAAGASCRWHDLRHSAASQIAAGGATDQTLQALPGWMSPKMIEKYSHVRAEAKRRAVAVFDVVASDLESPQNPPQSAAVEKQNIM
jgi:integrase